jgi:hypothetical protein
MAHSGPLASRPGLTWITIAIRVRLPVRALSGGGSFHQKQPSLENAIDDPCEIVATAVRQPVKQACGFALLFRSNCYQVSADEIWFVA